MVDIQSARARKPTTVDVAAWLVLVTSMVQGEIEISADYRSEEIVKPAALLSLAVHCSSVPADGTLW